jgi:hypothetical protein
MQLIDARPGPRRAAMFEFYFAISPNADTVSRRPIRREIMLLAGLACVRLAMSRGFQHISYFLNGGNDDLG